MGILTRRRFGIVTLTLALLIAVAVFGAGEVLSRPVPAQIGAAPADLGTHPMSMRTAAGGTIAAWFAPGVAGRGAVLLLHGVRSDRRAMLGRARFLHAAGYAVLLVDLQAHGESRGERITFGVRESAGVVAALAWLRRELPGERIGVIGVSLGAASFVLASPRPAVEAVVLESMYPTIAEAVADRLALHLGSAARLAAPLLLTQLPLRLGIGVAELRPIDRLRALNAPLLLVAGAADRHTTLPEAQRLFDAAAAPKELWVVEGAAHVDLHAFAPGEYEERIGAFFARYLSQQ